MANAWTRRGFLGAIVGFVLQGCTGSGSFGSRVETEHSPDDVDRALNLGEPIYHASARSYLVPFNGAADRKALKYVYDEKTIDGIMKTGVMALYQKCTHLGCKVPWCGTSHWFECPCHGSQYNQVGEVRGGPSPRGLDRFVVRLVDGNLEIDTGEILIGPPPGTDTTGQQPEGPHCVDYGH
jgi:cytochrome b6-f complex iron-sulfur subunit